jgi:hypothetical protein
MNYSKKIHLSCHINKIEETWVPELNYPKSVTNIGTKAIKSLYSESIIFRHGVKMPKPANLNSKDIDEIVYYLDMANHKL